MQDKKNYVIPIIAIVVILGFIAWGWKSGYLENSQKSSEQGVSTGDDSGTSTDIIYYYGKECSHCADVAKFLEENKIAEKVDFSKREVWHNTKNKQAMEGKAKECNITPEGMGVPFLYAREKCLVGTPNVIDFFKKEAGL
jgi:glutaredoxin